MMNNTIFIKEEKIIDKEKIIERVKLTLKKIGEDINGESLIETYKLKNEVLTLIK